MHSKEAKKLGSNTAICCCKTINFTMCSVSVSMSLLPGEQQDLEIVKVSVSQASAKNNCQDQTWNQITSNIHKVHSNGWMRQSVQWTLSQGKCAMTSFQLPRSHKSWTINQVTNVCCTLELNQWNIFAAGSIQLGHNGPLKNFWHITTFIPQKWHSWRKC